MKVGRAGGGGVWPEIFLDFAKVKNVVKDLSQMKIASKYDVPKNENPGADRGLVSLVVLTKRNIAKPS
jgi:hypothetical protein